MARIVQPPAIDGKDGDLSLDVELREHIAAVGTEHDALPRFAARQLADARGVVTDRLNGPFDRSEARDGIARLLA